MCEGDELTPEKMMQVVRDALDDLGVEYDDGVRPDEVVATLPGECKLRTVCSILASPRGLKVSAFVIRRPDENHEEFWHELLRRNLRLPGLAYATDPNGDVYVVGRLAAEAVNPDRVDELLGAVLAASDEAFNPLLAIGFISSMRAEWKWRVSRGESTRNLEAFRHLLEDDGAPTAQESTGG